MNLTFARRLSILIMSLSLSLLSYCQIFYKIEGNGVEKPSYLFGTHHLAPLKVFLDSMAKEAFADVDNVIVETDLTVHPAEISAIMLRHALAPADSTLTKIFSPEEFSELNSKFTSYSPMAGMDLTMFDGMKPMTVVQMVTVKVVSENMPGYNPEEQLDTFFMKEARAAGKKLIPLESLESQFSFLYDAFPISAQADELKKTLMEPEEVVRQSVTLNELYLARDINSLYDKSMEMEVDPEFFEILLTRRNREWMKSLPPVLGNGSSFIAVGALHLPGEDGLIESLRRAGFTVTPCY